MRFVLYVENMGKSLKLKLKKDKLFFFSCYRCNMSLALVLMSTL